MKRLREIGAIGAAVTLALSLDMTWWHAVILWGCLDLMTSSKEDV